MTHLLQICFLKINIRQTLGNEQYAATYDILFHTSIFYLILHIKAINLCPVIPFYKYGFHGNRICKMFFFPSNNDFSVIIKFTIHKKMRMEIIYIKINKQERLRNAMPPTAHLNKSLSRLKYQKVLGKKNTMIFDL